ncbi:GntR family transcriptional regulator [bacterium]|nr:GntR family transcriptional regulator [bacterium]
MLLHLSDLSSEPLQGQIVRQVRALILAGDLPAGTGLPSIRALAREQKVSVITVQRAYEALIQEGVIHARRGKGFFVSDMGRQEKKRISRVRLFEELKLPVEAAANEGLSAKAIHETVDMILNAKNRDTSDKGDSDGESV